MRTVTVTIGGRDHVLEGEEIYYERVPDGPIWVFDGDMWLSEFDPAEVESIKGPTSRHG